MNTLLLVAATLDVPIESTTTSVTVMLMMLPLVVLTPVKKPQVTAGLAKVGVVVVWCRVVGEVAEGITYDH